MLKKAGIAVAVAAAGVLTITPFAFAKDHQDNDQSSAQGKGVADGHSLLSGEDPQVCSKNLATPTGPGETLVQKTGTCKDSSTEKGKVYRHHKSNDD